MAGVSLENFDTLFTMVVPIAGDCSWCYFCVEPALILGRPGWYGRRVMVKNVDFFIVDNNVNLCWSLFIMRITRSARSVCKAGYCLNEGTCTVAIIAPGIPIIAFTDWMFGVIIFTTVRRAPASLFLLRRIQRGSLPAQTRADNYSKQDNYIIIILQNWSISLPGYIVVTIVCLSFAAVIVISTWWITTR